MKCCSNCFGDKGLKRIFPSLSDELGDCNYCLSKSVLIGKPTNLQDLITPLLNIYEENKDGKLLTQLLRDDWGIFEHIRMDDLRSSSLLAEILDDGEIVRKLFIPAPVYETNSLSRWEILRDELMYGNRYFPATEIKQERLEELLRLLRPIENELPETWYRARLMTSDKPFQIEEMGAPPREYSTHGRANPSGIPYLYLSSSPTTAVAEIRPHTGEQACIAQFKVPLQRNFVDLRSPRHTVSPLDFGDEVEIGYLRSDLKFLSRLGDELTRPVLPKSAATDYVPSQYVCEFIKKCGYDGVVYRSSVGDGINLALFQQKSATPSQLVKITTVTRVSVEIQAK